jgi:cobalt/nickel transport system permease protein
LTFHCSLEPSSPKISKSRFLVRQCVAVFAPLGLIAPGFAFGEGSPDDVKAAFGYVPDGLQQLNGIWNAPLSGYTINANFFTDPKAPLWHATLGYEISGIIGILLLVLVVSGLFWLIRRLSSRPAEESSASTEESV